MRRYKFEEGSPFVQKLTAAASNTFPLLELDLNNVSNVAVTDKNIRVPIRRRGEDGENIYEQAYHDAFCDAHEFIVEYLARSNSLDGEVPDLFGWNEGAMAFHNFLITMVSTIKDGLSYEEAVNLMIYAYFADGDYDDWVLMNPEKFDALNKFGRVLILRITTRLQEGANFDRVSIAESLIVYYALSLFEHSKGVSYSTMSKLVHKSSLTVTLAAMTALYGTTNLESKEITIYHGTLFSSAAVSLMFIGLINLGLEEYLRDPEPTVVAYISVLLLLFLRHLYHTYAQYQIRQFVGNHEEAHLLGLFHEGRYGFCRLDPAERNVVE